MLAYFRIFLLLFFPLVILFFIVQFSVHPFLEGHSSQKLITNATGLPSKVVLIVIDALRYNYRNRFAVIDKTIKQFPQSTFFAKSRVGSPTMTTQRVQSLMTGSQIFSIVNILRTFEAMKVETDNIIWQLSNQSKISAAFGDNTWTTLFDFSHSVVCNNSFDIHDIDSCDQQVYSSLPQQVHSNGKNKIKGDFIVAHLLGIDHVGHSTSSITHPKMDTKINQISAFLQQLFNCSEDGTYFIVTGDHAMRGDGNHGGSSDQETQTFLFSYFKRGKLYQQAHYLQLSQIQLTSTLSILLDIPLPLNTIGNPLLELLPRELVNEVTVREININLCRHYMKMLQFYTQQSFSDYFQKLQNAATLSYQKQILEQLTQKLSFLKFSAPKTANIVTISVSVSVLVLFFLLYAFSEEMLRLVFNTSLKIICQIVLSALGLFTLLSSFLSWDLTKNLSNSLLFGLLLTVLTGFIFKRRDDFNWGRIFSVLGCIFVLAQTETDKSNEYKTSIIRISYLHQFLSQKYLQLLTITGLLLLVWKTIRNTNTKQKENIYSRLLYYLRVNILVLSYVNYILVHIIIQPIYFLSTLLAFTIILCLIAIPFLKVQSSLTKIETTTMLCCSFLGLFMNEHYPAVVLTSWMFNRITYEYSSWAIMVGLWAKCVWWWAMGNRYQYSGVNILRTYVFSQSYSTLLNGISLIFYLNSPFFLNLVFLNSKICQQHQYLFLSQVVINKSRVLEEQQQSILKTRNQSNQNYRNKQVFNGILLKNNYKYVSVLVIGVVGALWATIQNNQKLIFTIMCAPLLVLTTFITFSSLFFIWILAECFAKMVNFLGRRPSNIAS